MNHPKFFQMNHNQTNLIYFIFMFHYKNDQRMNGNIANLYLGQFYMFLWFHRLLTIAAGVKIFIVDKANKNASTWQHTIAQPIHYIIQPKQFGFAIYLNRNQSIFLYFFTFLPSQLKDASSLAVFQLSYFAFCKILSDFILIHIPIKNITVPIMYLGVEYVQIFLVFPVPCKYPFAEVNIKALTTISKGTFVLVFRDSGYKISLLKQWIINKRQPNVSGWPSMNIKQAAHTKFGTQKINQASLGGTYIFIREFCNLPQLSLIPNIVSHPKAVQAKTVNRQI